ncbi:MAG: hypothetical protein AB3N20_12110 [Rhizobiaceae bacterium]
MTKTILAVLSAWHGLNGIVMLAMPVRWYETVPGVTHTGPFNGHFIADIAIAFLASAIGLALAAFRSGSASAAFMAAPAVFLGGHAVLHAVEFFHGHLNAYEVIRDTATIIVPGLLPALLALRIFQYQTRGAAT